MGGQHFLWVIGYTKIPPFYVSGTMTQDVFTYIGTFCPFLSPRVKGQPERDKY